MGAVRRLLDRQLRSHFGATSGFSAELEGFVTAVEAAYRERESDYALLERSLELSSQELLQANSEMRVIIQAFPDLFFWLTPDGAITGCRARDEADLMSDPASLIGRRIQDLPGVQARDVFQSALAQVATGASMVPVEYSLQLRESEQFYEARLMPLRPGQVLAIVRNITDRKRVELERTRSISVLQATFDSTADGILVIDLDGLVSSFNRRFVEMWSLPEGSLSARPEHELLVLLAGRLKFPHGLESLLDQAHPAEVHLLEHLDGRFIELHSRPQLLNGVAVGRVWSFRDVTERETSARTISESERRYRLLFDANPHPMWVFDTETLAFLAVNDAAVEHYGYSRDEFLAMTIVDIRPTEDRPAIIQRIAELASGKANDREWRHLKRDGTQITVMVRSHRLDFLGRSAALALVDDVTSQRLLETQLRQTQKLEAVGQLAGGVAHDFNNLLTAISGYGQLLQSKLDEDSGLRTYSTEILKASRRGAGLTRQLLAFSRQQILELKPIDLNAVVTDVQRMLERLIGEDIALEVALDCQFPITKADRGQLEQVILNLVVNSRDAMPHGGRLSMNTSNAVLEGGAASDGTPIEPGGYILLEVHDTGVGMSAEVQARMFEPFYTTKEQGRGTGLGLATVYGIIRQSGGIIRVQSTVGAGTTFQIFLPACSDSPERERDPLVIHRDRMSGETILLVEDDPTVRALVRELLVEFGYLVLEASDGGAAVDLANTHQGEIHLVLTDVIMPGPSGRETADRLLYLRPQLRVLFMSGYTDDQVLRHGIHESGVAFLQKPFTGDELQRKIRECLSAGPKRIAA
jgi:two-component system cell cycle sensor histidine kinase/response regulator CckA